MKLKTSAILQVYAQYRHFTIQSEASNYVMAVEGYSGNAGNSFLEGSSELFGVNRTMTIHNSMMFSTYDRDNDNWWVFSNATSGSNHPPIRSSKHGSKNKMATAVSQTQSFRLLVHKPMSDIMVVFHPVNWQNTLHIRNSCKLKLAS